MTLRHNDLFIPPDGSDPFVNCKLDRKKYADVLTSIVETYANGFVLAINNPWGEGKTTFVKMWRQSLKNAEFKTLYFNAWENDFQEDVLVALLAELEVLNDTKTEKNYKKVLEKATPLIKKAGQGLIKGLAKKAGLDEMLLAIIEGATEATLKGLENEIELYTKRKKGIEDFRETLETYVELISKDRPVIFIIDELDRCRPSYAVKVLEQVKHLFSVPGIVFVLSIDKEQLGNAVRGVYGSDRIDAEEYLRRFIDLEYSMPRPNVQQFIDYLYNYYDFDNFLNDKRRTQYEVFSSDNDRLKILGNQLFSRGFTLRQIEKMFSRVRVVVKTITYDQYMFPEIIILLSFLDEKHPEMLRQIRRKEYSIQNLSDRLDETMYSLMDDISKRRFTFLVASFLGLYANDYLTPFRKTEKLVDRSDPNESKLGITSKFNDEHNSLLHALNHYYGQTDTNEIGIDVILNRYDLLENLKS